MATKKPAKKSKATKVAAVKPQQPAKAEKPQGGPEAAYRDGSSYGLIVAALLAMGIGKMHPLDSIVGPVKKSMGADWKEFAAKKSETAPEARIATNVAVTARADYGKPLTDRGYQVKFDGREKLAGLFKV